MTKSGESAKRTEEPAHWSQSSAKEEHPVHEGFVQDWSWHCSLSLGLCCSFCFVLLLDSTQWIFEAVLMAQTTVLTLSEGDSGLCCVSLTEAGPLGSEPWSEAQRPASRAKTEVEPEVSHLWSGAAELYSALSLRTCHWTLQGWQMWRNNSETQALMASCESLGCCCLDHTAVVSQGVSESSKGLMLSFPVSLRGHCENASSSELYTPQRGCCGQPLCFL